MIRTTILHCKPEVNRPLENTLEFNLMLEIVPNLNFWLQFCLHTSSISRGEKTNRHSSRQSPSMTDSSKILDFFYHGELEVSLLTHFSQFWAKCLVFLETVMPKVYFNRVKKECFKTISCMCSVNSWKKVKVKSLSRVWLFATPWTVAHQAPQSLGFSRHEYGSGLPFPSPGNLPDPGIEPRSPALQADALTSEPPGKPCVTIRIGKEGTGSEKPVFLLEWKENQRTIK